VRVERFPTEHAERGRAGQRVQGVVVHTTVGTWAGTCSWFAAPASGVSAHYLVGLDGRVAQFVDEEDTAYHAGRVLRPTASLVTTLPDGVNPNLATVGIEFEDDGDPHGVVRPDVQYLVGGQLIARAARRWGFPLDRTHVLAHREVFAAKGCPGNLDVDRLVHEAVGWAGG
jgi:N-acetyl-anhydromuramyl-L-alanine amidase AmpD